MDATTFVTLLNETSGPVTERATAQDLSRLVPDGSSHLWDPTSNPDPICDLVTRWDVSRIEIRALQFLPQLRSIHGRVGFAKCEADWLAIDLVGGEIVFLDHAQPDFIMCPCAKSSAAFLDALALNLCSLASLEILYGDEEEFDELRAKCSQAAGGERYRPFFSTFI